MKIMNQNEMITSLPNAIDPYYKAHAQNLPPPELFILSKDQAQTYQKRKARKIISLL